METKAEEVRLAEAKEERRKKKEKKRE